MPATSSKGMFMTLATVRAEVDRLLADFCRANVRRAARLHPRYGRLWETISTVQLAGGKRVRPYVMTLAYEGLSGRNPRRILPAAAAIELLHTGLLMHDDIIDRDYLRHGEPNLAGRYRDFYAGKLFGNDLDHYSDSAGLLAGDLALAGAHQLINESGLALAERAAILERLSEAVFAVCGGELLDTEAVFEPGSENDSLAIASLKTASYSFVLPLMAGAELAGANEAIRARLRNLGEAMGVAYQMADDLLGLFGETEVTGKPVASDLEEGKRTYLMQQTLELAPVNQRSEMLTLLRKPSLSGAEVERARGIVTDCGARAATEQLIEEHSAEAHEILDTVPFAPAAKLEFSKLIDRAAKRCK